MNSFDTFAAAETDYRSVPAERLSHPKDGALAQQPKAERAPHSAVVRPQAAGKSRSTSLTSVRAFVSFAAGAVAIPEYKEYWFEPTPRGTFFLFLVQDRLRASDVLHRDWDWSRWL
jgi:hypothetical protein